MVDSRTGRSLRMLLIFVTKKSQHLSANIFLDSAVGNDVDLVLPIRLSIIPNNFSWSPSHSCICLLRCSLLAFSIKHSTVSHSSLYCRWKTVLSLDFLYIRLHNVYGMVRWIGQTVVGMSWPPIFSWKSFT